MSIPFTYMYLESGAVQLHSFWNFQRKGVLNIFSDSFFPSNIAFKGKLKYLWVNYFYKAFTSSTLMFQ